MSGFPTHHRRALLASISVIALAAPGGALAQAAVTDVGEVIVTATRREASVQDVPINISAVGGLEIERQGATDLAEIAAFVPGVYLVDQGGRTSDRITFRGLNVDAIGQTDVIGNNGGDIVSTYLGEIPIYIDLKLNDMERVEFLKGPQGTLYGAGTMGGAIRYIPRRPRLGVGSFEIRGDGYKYDEASSFSYDYGATGNFPIGDTVAVRASLDFLKDSGFIDYDYVVAQPGITNPNILTGPGITPKKDRNGEQTVSGRLGVRWQPTTQFDVNLTYYYQKQRSEGRTISGHASAIMTDRYVSPLRVLEPNTRENGLLALEITADLGFAELTSATGYARYKERGQRDQTNLLVGFAYGYELFPSFTALTLEDQDDETWTQEVRLVSKTDGPLSWIVGGFYSKLDSEAFSKEFTPGFDLYAVNNLGGGQLRPDSLEYFAPGTQDLKQLAGYGEVSYQITDAWQITGGVRYYDYKLKTSSAVDLPLLETVFNGRDPNSVVLTFEDDGQKADGFLFKFNTSYKLGEDKLVYFTYSEGYRIGGGNGIAACPVPLGNFQNVCAMPDEIAFQPDETINYELGAKTQWLDGRLTLNGAVYFIEWKGPQLLSATLIGGGTITRNGDGAETKGFELDANFRATERLTVSASYSYTDAKLTADAPDFVRTIPDPATNPQGNPFVNTLVGAFDGDRLSGSPRHQGAVQVTYTQPLSDGLDLEFRYQGRYVGDILYSVGSRGGFPKFDDFSLHDVSATLSSEEGDWRVTLYAENLFDKFVEVGGVKNPWFNQAGLQDDTGRTVFVRTGVNVLPPRKVGLRFTKRFGG
ncbi:TonB-dependent receptor [uncultured Phenylobacterium sp.]|uniref:TonB-dependent receptor n=1 Tax=uncultured Phenylobacterium sp. TaxID=349273 RepID=UPI0025E933CF|nr:TonB-dependent receptor [uncultured Phenylobacterium sp.]